MVEITLKNAEKRPEKLVKQTLTLFRQVLDLLGYRQGTWGVTFVEQARNRSDRKWWPLRIGPNSSIIVKTKPAGNETCWELAIIPPKDRNIEQVYNNFLKIDGKQIRLLRGGVDSNNNNKIFVPPSPKPPILPVLKPIIPAQIVPVQKPEITNAEKPMQTELFPKTEVSKPFTLKVNKYATEYDKNTLLNALVALIELTNSDVSKNEIFFNVSKTDLSQKLSDKLGLAECESICSGSSDRIGIYNGTRILNVLCEEEYIEREVKLPTRGGSTPKVVGYILEAKGIDFVSKYSQFLPKHINDYIELYKATDRPEDLLTKVDLENQDSEIAQIEPIPQNEKIDSNDALSIIESKIGVIQPLMDEHDKICVELDEFKELVITTKQNFQTEEALRIGLKVKADDLQNQLDNLKKLMEDSDKKLNSLLKEEEYINLESQTANQKLTEIKNKLQELLK